MEEILIRGCIEEPNCLLGVRIVFKSDGREEPQRAEIFVDGVGAESGK
jgi:hypothetical protein